MKVKIDKNELDLLLNNKTKSLGWIPHSFSDNALEAIVEYFTANGDSVSIEDMLNYYYEEDIHDLLIFHNCEDIQELSETIPTFIRVDDETAIIERN